MTLELILLHFCLACRHGHHSNYTQHGPLLKILTLEEHRAALLNERMDALGLKLRQGDICADEVTLKTSEQSAWGARAMDVFLKFFLNMFTFMFVFIKLCVCLNLSHPEV